MIARLIDRLRVWRRPNARPTWHSQLTEAHELLRLGHPEAAAMVARVALELRTREITRQLEADWGAPAWTLPRRYAGILRRLGKHHAIDDGILQTLRSLYAMTSRACHGRPIHRFDVLEALQAIEATLEQLEALASMRNQSA